MKQQPAGNLQNYFVPTAEMLGGQFQPVLPGEPGLGLRQRAERGQRSSRRERNQPDGMNFPGGIIPKSMLDPNSAILLNLFPKSNTDVTKNATGTNYQYFVGPPQNRWEYRVRGDYYISDKTKLFFSWNRQHEENVEPDQHLVAHPADRCRTRPPRRPPRSRMSSARTWCMCSAPR